jgi:hypothetical protein
MLYRSSFVFCDNLFADFCGLVVFGYSFICLYFSGKTFRRSIRMYLVIMYFFVLFLFWMWKDCAVNRRRITTFNVESYQGGGVRRLAILNPRKKFPKRAFQRSFAFVSTGRRILPQNYATSPPKALQRLSPRCYPSFCRLRCRSRLPRFFIHYTRSLSRLQGIAALRHPVRRQVLRSDANRQDSVGRRTVVIHGKTDVGVTTEGPGLVGRQWGRIRQDHGWWLAHHCCSKAFIQISTATTLYYFEYLLFSEFRGAHQYPANSFGEKNCGCEIQSFL